jgi:protein TonB
MKPTVILILFSLFCLDLKSQSIEPPYRNKDTTHLTVGDSTFTIVEIESEFPGGAKGWIRYLTDNFNYPKAAVRKRIQGTVVVQFIIDKEGNVTDAEVIKSVHPLLDKEALRLIQESPKWKPAMQGGKKVKSYKKQPVVFQLQPA